MNTALILKIADALEASTTNGLPVEGLGFNMALFCDDACRDIKDKTGHNCDTVACIAGWTVAMKSSAKDKRLALLRMSQGWDGDIASSAARHLGLAPKAAEALFYPPTYGEDDRGQDITPSQAASVLRHLAATGIVDWSIIDQAEAS